MEKQTQKQLDDAKGSQRDTDRYNERQTGERQTDSWAKKQTASQRIRQRTPTGYK